MLVDLLHDEEPAHTRLDLTPVQRGVAARVLPLADALPFFPRSRLPLPGALCLLLLLRLHRGRRGNDAVLLSQASGPMKRWHPRTASVSLRRPCHYNQRKCGVVALL